MGGNSRVIGVDIGGTKVAAAVVSQGANGLEVIGEAVVVPTRAAEGFDVSFGQVCQAIDACLGAQDLASIGICAPGPLNPKTGVVINPPNLPGWVNVPLAELVAGRYGMMCRVENDANAAGLAEALFGAGRGYSNVFYVTLSTGVGAGIILDGKIYHGRNGAAAEGGHVTIDYRSSSICICGVPGCIEALASGSAILRRGQDPAALTAEQFEEVTTMLGAWLGSVVSLLDPDVIVVGGGMTRIGEPLFAALRAKMPRWTINQFASGTPIVKAAFVDQCGILGAASVVL
ncbi:MAG: ROK family protein [Bryobacteraceae bacterium]|nr:ROK family protein [Bryobacteraceae bacterium]